MNDDEEKNKIVEEAIEQFAFLLVGLIDEIHTPKKKDSESFSEEIIS